MKHLIFLTCIAIAVALDVLILLRLFRRSKEPLPPAPRRGVPALRWYSYDELPLRVYLRILDIAGSYEAEDGMPLILAELTGLSEADILALPLDSYTLLVASTDWLQRDPATVPVRRRYACGPWMLTVPKDYKGLSASQFIDAQAILSEPEGRMLDILSTVLVPEGHTYGDGYDIDEVKDAIGQYLHAPDAAAIRGFFLKRSRRLMRAFLTSSAVTATKGLKRAKTPWERERWRAALETVTRETEAFKQSGAGSQPLTMSLTLPVVVGRMLLRSL